MFDWCEKGNHQQCIREFERFTIDPKTHKMVLLGIMVKCECSKRGCPCHVPAKSRAKKTRRKK